LHRNQPAADSLKANGQSVLRHKKRTEARISPALGFCGKGQQIGGRNVIQSSRRSAFFDDSFFLSSFFFAFSRVCLQFKKRKWE
jgi:hypothetical protein